MCQSQEIKNLGKLDDGSIVVQVDGETEKRLAITKAQLDSWAKLQIDVDSLNAQKASLIEEAKRHDQIIELADKNVLIAHQQREIERQSFVHCMSLYEKEREMRQELSKFAPKAPPKGIAGAFLRFLDSPAGEITFRLVIPMAQGIKVFTSK